MIVYNESFLWSRRLVINGIVCINKLDIKSNKREEQIKNSNICLIKERKNILVDPIIRNLEKAFEDMSERITNSKFEYKTIAYKRLNSQL